MPVPIYTYRSEGATSPLPLPEQMMLAALPQLADELAVWRPMPGLSLTARQIRTVFYAFTRMWQFRHPAPAETFIEQARRLS